MLKIKEGIDLKELEKYGFKIKKSIPKYITRHDGSKVEYLVVCGQSGKNIGYMLNGKNYGYGIWNLDILYDLIKDDLVEKVKE